MNVSLLSYVAPLIPAATSVVNEWKEWRRRHKERANVFLIVCAVAVAEVLLVCDNQQRQAAASEMRDNIVEQARILSDVKSQNQNLITRNQDLQNDMDALRERFKVRSRRTRNLEEKLAISDSLKVTVKRSQNP